MGGVSIVDGVTGLDITEEILEHVTDFLFKEELVWYVLAGYILADDDKDELILLNLLTLLL